MQKKEEEMMSVVSFTELTPRISFGEEIPDPQYGKAFLSPDPDTNSEYGRNTTAWD